MFEFKHRILIAMIFLMILYNDIIIMHIIKFSRKNEFLSDAQNATYATQKEKNIGTKYHKHYVLWDLFFLCILMQFSFFCGIV